MNCEQAIHPPCQCEFQYCWKEVDDCTVHSRLRDSGSACAARLISPDPSAAYILIHAQRERCVRAAAAPTFMQMAWFGVLRSETGRGSRGSGVGTAAGY